MYVEALQSMSEPVSGIPSKVNTEQRVEEPRFLTVVSIDLGIFHPLCTQSFSVFSRLLFWNLAAI